MGTVFAIAGGAVFGAGLVVVAGVLVLRWIAKDAGLL